MKLNIFCINNTRRHTQPQADEQSRLKSGLALGLRLLVATTSSSAPSRALLFEHICISTSVGQLLACYFNFEAIVYHFICMWSVRLISPGLVRPIGCPLHFLADNVSLLAGGQNHLHFLPSTLAELATAVLNSLIQEDRFDLARNQLVFNISFRCVRFSRDFDSARALFRCDYSGSHVATEIAGCCH